jgi:hypothetical protein
LPGPLKISVLRMKRAVWHAPVPRADSSSSRVFVFCIDATPFEGTTMRRTETTAKTVCAGPCCLFYSALQIFPPRNTDRKAREKTRKNDNLEQFRFDPTLGYLGNSFSVQYGRLDVAGDRRIRRRHLKTR